MACKKFKSLKSVMTPAKKLTLDKTSPTIVITSSKVLKSSGLRTPLRHALSTVTKDIKKNIELHKKNILDIVINSIPPNNQILHVSFPFPQFQCGICYKVFPIP